MDISFGDNALLRYQIHKNKSTENTGCFCVVENFSPIQFKGKLLNNSFKLINKNYAAVNFTKNTLICSEHLIHIWDLL